MRAEQGNSLQQLQQSVIAAHEAFSLPQCGLNRCVQADGAATYTACGVLPL
jgi:hypothetical protein